MTALDFINKFPDCKTVNSEFLEDTACPECGNRQCFNIVVEKIAEVTDDYCVSEVSDTEWHENSRCTCDKCGHTGLLYEAFRFDGLDELLWEKRQEVTTQ